MAVRIPGWAQNQPVPSDLYTYRSADSSGFALLVNGKPVSYVLDMGYAVVSRKWKKGDVVGLDLPMPVRRVKAHEKVTADQGRVALQRGLWYIVQNGLSFPMEKSCISRRVMTQN